jgi:hypothetical protein
MQLPLPLIAVYEQPATVAADYKVPINSPNLGSIAGGIEAEGL